MNEPAPEIIQHFETPRGDIQLQRRGEHYEIISNGTFLMATYNGESEKRLVNDALQEIPEVNHVLIGGLGVGFSLAEALSHEAVARVTVVEIEEAMIDWNHTYLAAFSNHALNDDRTKIVHDDFIKWMMTTTEKFDAICLDIDNGPVWTVTDSNMALYQADRLHVLAGLLTSQGVVAFWSAAASKQFVEQLKNIFKEVKEISIPQDRGAADYIYLAKFPL